MSKILIVVLSETLAIDIMGSGTDHSGEICPHCGERRPANQFYEFQDEKRYCANCLVRRDCANCGETVITLEGIADQRELYCDTCADSSESSSLLSKPSQLLKRGAVAIGGLLLLAAVRLGDELLVFSLRFLDELNRIVVSVARPFIEFRPLLFPGVAFFQETIAYEITLILFLGAVLLIVLDTVFFGPVKVFDVVTFPGTVIHEWAHKKTCERYGLEVTDVTYFQFDSTMGQVSYHGVTTFWQDIRISTAPLLFNSVAAVCIAIVGTISASRIGFWGTTLIYWLAFSVGTGALPSHVDIDNIWNRILDRWRHNPKVLLGVPVVLVLRLLRILKAAYLEAILGLMTVLTGIIIGQIIV